MDSIVNYESDDGNLKLPKKSKSKVITVNIFFQVFFSINFFDIVRRPHSIHRIVISVPLKLGPQWHSVRKTQNVQLF